jgi:hypothetical protein
VAWCEFDGELRVPFIGWRGDTKRWPRREGHHARWQGRLKRGDKACPAGGGGMQEHPGVPACGGVFWFTGEQKRSKRGAVAVLLFSL